MAVLLLRFLRGDDYTRRQLFWIMLSVLASVVLLATGIVATVVGPAFGMLSLLPLPIGILIAILRMHLFDVKLVSRERPTSISNRWLAQSLAKVDELYRRQGDPMCLDVALALV